MARRKPVPRSGEHTRERIVQAALQAFAQKGFDGASTREIVSKIGVNHGLIPYYFGTKEKLWQAAVDLAFADLGKSVQEILSDASITDARERAARMIHAHVRFIAQRPEFVRLMHDEGKRGGPRLRWIVDRYVEPLYRGVSELLEQGRASGALANDIPPLHFFYILAGATGVIFHQAEECKRLTGVDPFDPAVVEEHARAVERMVLGPPSDHGKG
ncbi:MAG: TetR/AcrR family transcriptional regulator [bacterium]|nr:TetR/AcrR family transcriptional regulator [bacterium]